jgi:putative transposase
MDETYVKIRGEWKYLYRAVDKEGNTVDFLLRARRNKAAAQCYFEKSIQQNGVPETVTIDKSGANLAALHAVNAGRDTLIKIRQVKYLNNVVEQDHRAIKRIIRPMLGFKDFRCARVILSGIEIHAYDRQRADETHWRNQAICRPPVLLVGDVSDPHHIAFVRLNCLTATEPA